MINRIIAAVFALIGICIVANAQQGNTNVGRTGTPIPLYGGLLGLNSSGNLVGWPGDSSNGAWVNIKASSLGVVEGSNVSVGLSTGQPTMGYVISSPPTYTTGTFDYPSLTTAGSQRSDISSVAGTAITSSDPCKFQAKTNVAISTVSGTTALVTGVSGKKIYVCSLVLVPATAIAVSLSEGSSNVCGTSAQAAVIGVATNGTASNGMSLVANGIFTLGSGVGTVAATATAANYLCLFQSGTARISGNFTYVRQ